MTEKEKEKDKENVRYKLTEVPENFRLAIVDSKTEEAFTELDLLVKIANDIEEIKKAVK